MQTLNFLNYPNHFITYKIGPMFSSAFMTPVFLLFGAGEPSFFPQPDTAITFRVSTRCSSRHLQYDFSLQNDSGQRIVASRNESMNPIFFNVFYFNSIKTEQKQEIRLIFQRRRENWLDNRTLIFFFFYVPPTNNENVQIQQK